MSSIEEELEPSSESRRDAVEKTSSNLWIDRQSMYDALYDLWKDGYSTAEAAEIIGEAAREHHLVEEADNIYQKFEVGDLVKQDNYQEAIRTLKNEGHDPEESLHFLTRIHAENALRGVYVRREEAASAVLEVYDEDDYDVDFLEDWADTRWIQ
ncbi:MAG: hypothetical protein ABEJ72_00660 [Candidatus Aenigmatarchaeota archaeon]